ncbi:hypothetical protein [Maribacter dokdonensis]|uniref:hypothetical protein n=1 Tax=Maribacter dokdonensis TaxID=320912 RepID=UPI002AB11675|nr:hypothetical protein [Maribacter dokdonensis]
MEKLDYTIKKYVGNSDYVDFDISLEDISLSINLNPSQLHFLEPEMNGNLINFEKVSLPTSSYNNLKSLLNHFNLSEQLELFVLLLANTQHYYLLYSEKVSDSMMEDFMEEKKEMVKFLSVLEKSLFYGGSQTHSISFKFKEETITIKNNFIQSDIYRVLLNQFDISKENFRERKEELLNSSSRFRFEKGGEYVKSVVVQYISNLFRIYASTIGQNQLLRFSGVFLHIAEIPSNNNLDEVVVGDIDNALRLIDYTNMRHYLKPRTSFSN